MHFINNILILFLFFITQNILYAEDNIDIFDQNRGEEKSNTGKPLQNRKPLTPKRRVSNRRNKTEFSLNGISRFSNKYTLYFTNKKRKAEQFIWIDDDKVTQDEIIYQDYTITKVLDRKVYLKLKGNKICLENESQGISCDKANKLMILEIVHKTANSPIRKPARTNRPVKKKKITTAKTIKVN